MGELFVEVEMGRSSRAQVIPISWEEELEDINIVNEDEENVNYITNANEGGGGGGGGGEQQPQQGEANPPQDGWLPITESRKGNSWSSTFLLISSGIGLQAFVLPVALVSLGWYWGIICLCVAFVWQLYTTCLLVHLHESVPPGIRYSRFLHLAIAAFGVKLGKLLALFPVMYLSGGTCTQLIINGGGTLRLLYQTLCGDNCTTKPLTGAEWYLVFVCLAILVALFCPNLNSVAKLSIVGSVTAVAFCTLLWILSIVKNRPDGVSYGPNAAPSEKTGVFGILNALGLIAIAFRGHNVVLEIQGTIRSSQKHPSKGPMQKGVTMSYLLIATCFFPLAIAGYWAYGNKIISTGGILRSFMNFHGDSTPKSVKAIIYLLVVINYVCAFQIYAMVALDNLERIYVTKKNRRCPSWLKAAIRVLYGGVTYFLAVTFPFLGALAPLVGGITSLPLTFAYPCFMWIAIKKPRRSSSMWWLNLGVGGLGVVLSVLVVVAAIRTLVVYGLKANFFKPS